MTRGNPLPSRLINGDDTDHGASPDGRGEEASSQPRYADRARWAEWATPHHLVVADDPDHDNDHPEIVLEASR